MKSIEGQHRALCKLVLRISPHREVFAFVTAAAAADTTVAATSVVISFIAFIAMFKKIFYSRLKWDHHTKCLRCFGHVTEQF